MLKIIICFLTIFYIYELVAQEKPKYALKIYLNPKNFFYPRIPYRTVLWSLNDSSVVIKYPFSKVSKGNGRNVREKELFITDITKIKFKEVNYVRQKSIFIFGILGTAIGTIIGVNEQRECEENATGFELCLQSVSGPILGLLVGVTLGFIIGSPSKGKPVKLNIYGNLDYYKSQKDRLEQYRYKWKSIKKD